MKYKIVCSNCLRKFNDEEVLECPECGNELKIEYFKKNKLKIKSKNKGVFRFIDHLPLKNESQYISIGEGNTPLHYSSSLANLLGIKNLVIKDETQNPTGSFKDRASAISINKALELKKENVAIGSGGNAAASAAAYSANAGLNCFVFLPKSTPKERIAQSLIFGANVIEIDGSINDAIKTIKKYKESLNLYEVTTAKCMNLFQGEGVKTIGYEIWKDLNKFELDYIFVPIGGGGILSNVWKSYKDLYDFGLINKLPKIIGVQPEGCAPLVEAFKANLKPNNIKEWQSEPDSIAVTIADVYPLDGEEALKSIYESKGLAISVSDKIIKKAIKLLASNEGVFVEPAGAAPLAGLLKLINTKNIDKNQNIALIATGHGLKDLNTTINIVSSNNSTFN